MEERWELAAERLKEWLEENACNDSQDVLNEFLLVQGLLLEQAVAIHRNPATMSNGTVNKKLYEDIAGEGYARSFTNPAVCAKRFEAYGKKTAQCLNWFAAHVRDVITAAYARDTWTVLVWLELFLELQGLLKDEGEDLSGSLKEMIYYFIHDYDEIRVERNIRELVVPAGGDKLRMMNSDGAAELPGDTESEITINDPAYRLVMERDHSDPSYLYEYGEYISDNELRLAAFLSEKSEDELAAMARTYTEGYRKGFIAAGIDLSLKKTVEIRYPIGMEPMVKKAVEQFREMDLEPALRRRTNTQAIGIVSTPPNRQYLHDHRFDDALYLNQALTTERLKHVKAAFDMYSEEASVYAGPAVIETFGEELFVPEAKPDAPKYTKEQEKISLDYKRDYMLLQDEYIPGDKRSFTIIAYPVPEIGETAVEKVSIPAVADGGDPGVRNTQGGTFEEIFEETVHLNNLDSDTYARIQQHIIDALDSGDYVRVRGRNGNRTDMKVMLHTLTDPAHQTNFENCVADVNIPVGEVFTSPVLTGTEGVLHVSQVFLNGLRYEGLSFTFRDGMVTDYACENYDDPAEGRAYIRENVLFNHDTLPIGEFAIGTNTTAYVMGKRFGIEAKLPILIAEKTGPHFALGDTCYSFSEEVAVHNPDGKEIIARDNECSIKRKEDPQKAYFQCHTDITIPYEELGSISVFTNDGKETIIIRDGRFVLPGTEELNKPLE